MNTLDLSLLLPSLADKYETVEFLSGDPSFFMHQVTGSLNQETMAFLAASISFGARKQFMPIIQELLQWSGGEPYRWILDGQYLRCIMNNESPFYRLYTNHQYLVFLRQLQVLLYEHYSLHDYLKVQLPLSTVPHQGLAALNILTQFFAHISPSPIPKDTTSACKRLCMFLRWMVRENSPVDLGIWADILSPSHLLIPLDTHVLQQAYHLGLISSRTASMKTAIRLTEILKQFFPSDPTRADYALFGLGVNHDSIILP